MIVSEYWKIIPLGRGESSAEGVALIMDAKRNAKLAPAALAAVILFSGLANAKLGYASVASEPRSDGQLTAEHVTQAIESNTLDQLIKNAVGSPPSTSGLSSLDAFLLHLTASDPGLAGATTTGLASFAWDTAPEDPATTFRMVRLAMSVVDEPAVIEAAPEQVVETIVTLAGAVQLAQRSAAAKNVGLTGADDLMGQIRALAERVAAVMDDLSETGGSSLSSILSRIAESIQLANAQADLAGFATAAGPVDLVDPLGTQGFSEFETAVGVQDEASPTGL